MTDGIASSKTTFVIGGDSEVRRLGFGAMRITGPGTWGPPPDRAAARALLRRAVELGVQLIDTADAYGPGVSEELIAETLSPYDGLLVATKGGYERTGPSGRSAGGELIGWTPNGRPTTCGPPARRRCAGSDSTASTSISCTPPTQPFPTWSPSARSRTCRARARSGTSASATSPSSNSPGPDP
jgi:hypothetical protein